MNIHSLPTETIFEICSHLQGGTCFGTENRSDSSLRYFGAACQLFQTLAEPLIWRTLHITLDRDNVWGQLAALQRLLSSCPLQQPALRYTTKLQVALPGLTYADRETAVATDRADALLTALIDQSQALDHVEIDFCMAQHPFRSVLDALFGPPNNLRISTIVATGLYNLPKFELVSVNASLRRLKLGYTGCNLVVDFTAFPNLTDLHLELDCRATTHHSCKSLSFPPSMWNKLQSLCLESSAQDTASQDLSAALDKSMQDATSVALQRAGIFLNHAEDDLRRVIQVFSKHAPRLDRLAFTTQDVMTLSLIDYVADKLPNLVELTCCAFQLFGSWKWPSSSRQYAQSFSRFPRLRTLAVNHYAAYDEMDGFGTPFSPKYTMEGSDAAVRNRLGFVTALVGKSKTLREVLFCPTEQDSSYIRVAREAEMTVAVEPNPPMLFWQGFA